MTGLWNPIPVPIVPPGEWFVTTIYKPFRPFGRGTTLHRELTNQLTTYKSWDDPPSNIGTLLKISRELEGFGGNV